MVAKLSLGTKLSMQNYSPVDLASEVGTSILPAANGGTARATYQDRMILLASKIGANMNSSADQVLTMASGLTKYIIRRITVTNASVNLTTAAGGFYTAASKGGTTVVANTQVYSALTASTKFVDLTLAAGVTVDVVTAALLYLSLTTPQGVAATADVYVFGEDLS